MCTYFTSQRTLGLITSLRVLNLSLHCLSFAIDQAKIHKKSAACCLSNGWQKYTCIVEVLFLRFDQTCQTSFRKSIYDQESGLKIVGCEHFLNSLKND